MNRRAMLAVVRKDLLVVRRSRAVFLPLLLVPLVLLVALPVGAILAARNVDPAELADLDRLLAAMPPELTARLAGYTDVQRMVVLTTGFFLAPLYLLVPVMVASVIAADAFAGERERKTLEALVYSPTTDRELFLAKLIGPWLAGVAVAWGGFVVYGLVVNVAAWPEMGRVFFPSAMWVVLALWVAPAVAALGLGAMVVVSARVRGFQEAYQLGGTVALPIVFLLIGQATGLIYFSLHLVVLLGAVVWALAAFLLAYGARRFRRGEILARL